MNLGAKIGTTCSSQVLRLDVDTNAPVAVAAGVMWNAVVRSDAGKLHATILLGLGLVLFGLNLIGTAAEPPREDAGIIDWLRRLENPLLGVAAGALLTVATQSSSTMMGIVIAFAGGGIIGLPTGAAIMLAAEIGACTDMLVARAGDCSRGVKARAFHLMFNIASAAGVLLIDQLAASGAATAGDTGQRIANALILLNVADAMAGLPFVGLLCAWLDRLIPKRGDATPKTAGAG